jgi:hypothetical protein
MRGGERRRGMKKGEEEEEEEEEEQEEMERPTYECGSRQPGVCSYCSGTVRDKPVMKRNKRGEERRGGLSE